MRTVQKLTLDDARVMMAAAEAKAREIGVDMDIAITDDNGSQLMFHRMDGGRITSIDVAISKAFTAAAARKSTRKSMLRAAGPMLSSSSNFESTPTKFTVSRLS